MKNKKVLSVILVSAALLNAAACSQSSETARTTTASTTSEMTTTAAATLAEEGKQALSEVETTYSKLENGTVKFLSSWDINPADGKPKQVSLEMFETNYGGKIEYVPCTWDTRYEMLGKMIASGDSPDMFSAGDLDCFPQGAVSKMFLPLDDYVDFDSELWAPMKEVNDQFVFDGKHYVGATSTDAGVVMIYNQNTIDENGLSDPAKLLEEGNWTWDTLYDMMISFCDRENEKFAVDGWWFESAISLTTGVPYVGMKDGKVVQNLDDPMIEKAQSYMLNMKKQDLPFPKSEYNWQIHPENIGLRKTLFYPCGMWALYVTDLSAFGKTEDIRFVPMPSCPYADDYYLPTSITGFTLCSGAKNPEGVAAYLDCLMICRDNEVAKKIEKEQLFEDYSWSETMYEMLLNARELTEQHPIIEFYTAVNDTVNDLVNNPMKESYNAAVSWTETKESIKMALQAELDSFNNKID